MVASSFCKVSWHIKKDPEKQEEMRDEVCNTFRHP